MSVQSREAPVPAVRDPELAGRREPGAIIRVVFGPGSLDNCDDCGITPDRRIWENQRESVGRRGPLVGALWCAHREELRGE
jgi:hypothetical protein